MSTVTITSEELKDLRRKAERDFRDMQWMQLVDYGLEKYLQSAAMKKVISIDHVRKTPERFVKSLGELFEGVSQSPAEALSTVFEDSSDEMIHNKEISFFSTCAHHLIPFFGTMNFAYIPNGKIVGLSKIPRLVNVFAHRPQVQEKLGTDIVEEFQRIVEPLGCAVMIRAFHLCCMARGVKQPTSYTETTALRGVFKNNASTKAEFLSSCNAPKWSA